MDDKENKKFLVDSNEVIEFKLVRKPADIEDESIVFKPEMSHQYFGDKEQIYGFKGLRIKLYYTAAWLNIYCGITFDEKADDAEVSDLMKKITVKYETDIIENIQIFENSLELEHKFVPFGTLMRSFTIDVNGKERMFEIYWCTTETKDFLSYHSRLQTFLLWFVDAACYINTDEETWNFFLIYEKYNGSDNGSLEYATVGYATIYEYYAYPANLRPRISQVLILPPFQKMGICVKLLSTIYDHYLSKNNIVDITVEDPSEQFQRVRDYVDCERCLSLAALSPEKLKDGFKKEMAAEMTTRFHINSRQARRVYEILRLNYTNTHDEEEYKAYRIDVKRRLNLPFQRQISFLAKCRSRMTPEEIASNFLSDDDRKARLENLYRITSGEYMSVIKRLNS